MVMQKSAGSGSGSGHSRSRSKEESERRLVFGKLQESSLYQTYKRAFRAATGLPLVMVFASPEETAFPCGGDHENRFCGLLNEGSSDCALCARANRSLCASASEKTRSVTCFAGLVETAVPVRCGKAAVAFLKTGQVLQEPPRDEKFEEAAVVLRELGLAEDRIAELRAAYGESMVVEPSVYHGMITILTAFAMQLGELANRIVLNQGDEEPEVVTKAKRFILENLDEPLSLDLVAGKVNVSSFYFCKLFKQATGLTFTEFVNRQRIEWAKKKLLEREARVTEVAFDVGYQSLSQFNRSFARIVGESPTEYRRSMTKRPDLLSA